MAPPRLCLGQSHFTFILFLGSGVALTSRCVVGELGEVEVVRYRLRREFKKACHTVPTRRAELAICALVSHIRSMPCFSRRCDEASSQVREPKGELLKRERKEAKHCVAVMPWFGMRMKASRILTRAGRKGTGRCACKLQERTRQEQKEEGASSYLLGKSTAQEERTTGYPR